LQLVEMKTGVKNVGGGKFGMIAELNVYTVTYAE
jgi:hypothetical protein